MKISECASIWYGASIRADLATIIIGKYTNVQDNCVLHTDPEEPLVIGDYVTVGHGAILHCKSIGNLSLIGMGSILLAGATIGNNCIIAAGCVVKEKQIVPDNTIFAGVPAKQISTTNDTNRADHEDRALRYYKLALKHTKEF
ncbi:MAG: gamma carbonic anhydrase family protein [Planctomycetes bacterium]|nr:gamma carbonic anhydrase family protein [Planctomycetota bacterium]